MYINQTAFMAQLDSVLENFSGKIEQKNSDFKIIVNATMTTVRDFERQINDKGDNLNKLIFLSISVSVFNAVATLLLILLACCYFLKRKNRHEEYVVAV